MFGHRYFGAAMFGPRYWGPKPGVIVVPPPVTQQRTEGGGGLIFITGEDLRLAEEEMLKALARLEPRKHEEKPALLPTPQPQQIPPARAPAIVARAAAVVEGEAQLRSEVDGLLYRVRVESEQRAARVAEAVDRARLERLDAAELDRAVARTETARAIAAADRAAVVQVREAVDAAKDRARHEVMKAILQAAVLLAEDD